MTRETADCLTRIGLVLGFVSFWFAAPEFIGEIRLRQWESALGRAILKLPFVAKAVMGTIFFGVTLLFISRWMITGRTDTITTATLLTTGIAAATAVFLQGFKPALRALVSWLANHDRVRQRSLFLGGFLFTISTVLQFIATFQTPPSH